MNCKQKTVYENYIPEEELPVKAGLKVMRTSGPDYGMSDDEVADRNEFIRCHLAREFELLMMIPSPAQEEENFFIPDYHASDDAYSAFNTHDFQRTLKPFDKYRYAMKKIMERVEAIAILHSVISREEGRENTFRRFDALVEFEFREPLLSYVDRYKAAKTDEQRQRLKQKIGELNRRILEAKKAWERLRSPGCLKLVNRDLLIANPFLRPSPIGGTAETGVPHPHNGNGIKEADCSRNRRHAHSWAAKAAHCKGVVDTPLEPPVAGGITSPCTPL